VIERRSTSPPRRIAPESDPTRYVYVKRTRCPRCESDDLAAYKTLTGADGVITRYTRCLSCKHRFLVVDE
jgi:DNA-directed RNA polymerase subunit M/transcription elongation factor TFIIS